MAETKNGYLNLRTSRQPLPEPLMPLTFSLVASPPAADIKALEHRLDDYFIARGAPDREGTFAVLARDAAGALIGGLYAKTGWDQLYIDTLHIVEAHRGQGLGAELMARAEAEGRRQDCAFAWLDTSAPEAKAFYEARGYTCFGAVERRAPSAPRWFMTKAL